MLRRALPLLQFQMGKYRGPLPPSPTPSSAALAADVKRVLSNGAKPPTPERPSDAAVLLAQRIADRVAREDGREAMQRNTLYERRLRQKHPQTHPQGDEQEELFEGVANDDVDDAAASDDSSLRVGQLTGRADFEIPTLAAAAPPEAWVFRPRLLDANRMPTSMDAYFAAPATAPQEAAPAAATAGEGQDPATADGEPVNHFKHIERLLSPALAFVFRRRRVEWNIVRPTPVQELTLSVALGSPPPSASSSSSSSPLLHVGEDRRDVCCIAPTSSGKTLCYVLPAIQTALECNGAADDASAAMTEARIRARDAARAARTAQHFEQKAVTCRYCGLNTRRQRICPQTGAPHPPVSTLVAPQDGNEAGEDGEAGEEAAHARILRRSAPPSVNAKAAATPFSLVLVPTNALVDQVHGVMRGLHCGLRVAAMRAGGVSEEAQARMLRLLAGCDVLVSTPAMALTLLRKKRLSLRQVRFVAVDEIDNCLELPQFDLLNLVLSQLPATVTGAPRGKHDSPMAAKRTSSSSSRDYYANSGAVSNGADGAHQVRRMLVGATLAKPPVPFAAKLLHPTKARWVVGSLLEDAAMSGTKGKSLSTPALPPRVAGGAPSSSSAAAGLVTTTAASYLEEGQHLAAKMAGDSGATDDDTIGTSAQHQMPALDTFGGVTVSTNISHSILMVSRLEKTDKIRWLYDTGRIAPTQQVIIFCNQIPSVKFLQATLPDSTLAHHDVKVVSVHAGQREEARVSALQRFRDGRAQILVATDAIARGIDFPNVFAVIQYDFPAHNFDLFVHRAGRCGRRGQAGRNFAMFEAGDARAAARLAAYLRQRRQDVPPQLAKYAQQSWTELYREQVQGLTQRRKDPAVNAAMHKNPLGQAENRFPRNAETTWRRNRFKESSD